MERDSLIPFVKRLRSAIFAGGLYDELHEEMAKAIPSLEQFLEAKQASNQAQRLASHEAKVMGERRRRAKYKAKAAGQGGY